MYENQSERSVFHLVWIAFWAAFRFGCIPFGILLVYLLFNPPPSWLR